MRQPLDQDGGATEAVRAEENVHQQDVKSGIRLRRVGRQKRLDLPSRDRLRAVGGEDIAASGGADLIPQALVGDQRLQCDEPLLLTLREEAGQSVRDDAGEGDPRRTD